MTIRNRLLALAGALCLAMPAQATGVLSFEIPGDTFNSTFTIINNSTAGETVLGFGLTLNAPNIFDTVNGAPGFDSAAAFVIRNNSGTTTGYTGPTSFADGVITIDFTFNNFGVGEAFQWSIDVDTPTTPTVLGSGLIGSTVYVDFSNGQRGLGTLQALPGNANGAQLAISSFTPTPGVPEPASWAMLLIGFGAVGTAMRRRSVTVSA